jgi:hypothetical protein
MSLGVDGHEGDAVGFSFTETVHALARLQGAFREDVRGPHVFGFTGLSAVSMSSARPLEGAHRS